MSENPYQAPEAFTIPSLPDGYVQQDPAEIRRAHIKHEASIKSIGFLYGLSTIVLTIIAFSSMVTAVNQIISGPADVAGWARFIGPAIIFIPLAILLGVTAYGIRKLKQWARIVAIILSAIGLIGVPVGTIISAYILYLLLSKKGSMVFSPEYKAIIAATPDVKYKTSIIVWIVLGLFLLLIVAGLMFAAFQPSR